VNRGDVVLAFYPFASGSGGKRRPGLVVQNDPDNARMAATILAQITTNLARVGEPTHLLIESSTTEGQQSGLLHDSLVSCNNLLRKSAGGEAPRARTAPVPPPAEVRSG
jgi:mRNA interferase MazF